MEKRDLIQFLNEQFIPLGFKRKGNNWVQTGDELTKIVNLQHSNWGNFFYINYGYNIKNLELTTKTHISKGLGSVDKGEYKLITDLLNLDNLIPTEERKSKLKEMISKIILLDFDSISTEHDLLTELKRRPNLNGIPLIVKQYFNLPLE